MSGYDGVAFKGFGTSGTPEVLALNRLLAQFGTNITSLSDELQCSKENPTIKNLMRYLQGRSRWARLSEVQVQILQALEATIASEVTMVVEDAAPQPPDTQLIIAQADMIADLRRQNADLRCHNADLSHQNDDFKHRLMMGDMAITVADRTRENLLDQLDRLEAVVEQRNSEIRYLEDQHDGERCDLTSGIILTPSTRYGLELLGDHINRILADRTGRQPR